MATTGDRLVILTQSMLFGPSWAFASAVPVSSVRRLRRGWPRLGPAAAPIIRRLGTLIHMRVGNKWEFTPFAADPPRRVSGVRRHECPKYIPRVSVGPSEPTKLPRSRGADSNKLKRCFIH